MTEKNPLVTICFLTYNYADKLEKALEPILHQSYQNIQLIVSNNQSTDTTEEVVKKIQQQYPKVIYRKNIPDLAADQFYDISSKSIPTGSHKKTYDILFNHCNSVIKSGLIKGEFVIFCHQDDVYQTDIVKKEVEFLIAHPNVQAVATTGKIINQDDSIAGLWRLPKELKEKNYYNFKEIFTAILRHGNFLLTPSFMLRTNTFEKVGLFDDQGPFGGADDLEMWLRILETYPIGIIQENLIWWRKGGRGKKYNQLRTDKADHFKLMDYYLKEKEYGKSVDKKSLRQYEFQKDFDNTLCIMHFLIKGEVGEAKKLINQSYWLPNFWAFLENPTLLRTKVLSLKVVLYLGINLNLGKPLGKFLYRFL